jgi:DNA invertase Pin-like site-specific DNA recombinase
MACYTYLRVSTRQQADDGESLGAQQRKTEGYAQMIEQAVTRHFIEEGVSGSVPLADRPQGRALLDVVRSGDIVITPKLDRCFRSAQDALNVLAQLKAKGVSLHMIDLGGDVTGNGISKLVFTILAAVAESERDRIRERVADIKADQRQRGHFLGGAVPFGYRVERAPAGNKRGFDMILVEDEGQQAAIRLMVEMKAAGKALRTIAEAVSASGHKITHAGVKKVLDALSERAAA